MPSAVSSSRGPSAALRFGRFAVMGTVAVLILVAGVWGSWGTAQYAMLTKGREQGTVAVTSCGGRTCTGAYTPSSPGSQPRAEVVLENNAAVAEGRTYTVVVKPDGNEVVRSGSAGVLHAWVPLGGALMLASVVVAGGLLRTRVAWVMGLSGVSLVTAAFLVV
ncbi:hypothetical protein [Streptomyces sp. KMM 9044]|uniref:hypothetical protein n=1 Tax=Streptomyces sp. KMM 9044 TaxID=2744474 RepID=UPI002150FEB0|nr:hypothetical protein [Streptomyces sp. KMM 9044]WAX79616.1 hypothetical protein HUV60_020020 [Streptomyces sp. KMM 9044]